MMTRTKVMIVLIAILMLAMMATPSYAAIPGPNDPRYPDVIVDPKVTCDKEGVFPHPRNCSWYYRCVDRMNVGFFWTYHFECEPGTVFSDELDQCVFPFATGPPCGTGGITSPPAPSPITSPATKPTTPATTTEFETTVQTITSPTVTKNFTCAFQPENCALSTPCLPGEPQRTLCTGCYVDGMYISAFFLCGQEVGKLFDRESNVCVDDPSLNPSCPLKDTTTTEAPTTTESTTTTTTPAPTTTNQPLTINITKEFFVHCTFDNLRPPAAWIDEKFCNQFFLCTPEGKYKDTVSLCENYYECSFTPEGGWDLILMSCPKDLIFSYDEDRCVEIPKDEEICDFGGR